MSSQDKPGVTFDTEINAMASPMTSQDQSVSNVPDEVPKRAPKRRIDPNRNPTIIRFLNDTEVGWRYGISRPSVWRWTKTGLLPGPEALGPNTKRWRVATLDDWDASRADQPIIK